MMIPSIASAKQGFKTHPKVYLPDNPSRSSGRRLSVDNDHVDDDADDDDYGDEYDDNCDDNDDDDDVDCKGLPGGTD